MSRSKSKILPLFNGLLIIVLASVLAVVMQVFAHKLPVRQYFPKNYTVAVWDWHNPTTHYTDDLRDLDQYFYLHQIDTVFVDISQYVDIRQSNDDAKKQKLEEAIARYVRSLQNHDVRVFAAAGSTDWSKPGQRHIPLAIQKFVFDYNDSHPDVRLSGLEFDIEAYNQKGFPESSATEKSLVLTELLDTVDELVAAHTKKIKAGELSSNFELGLAIPYWFDNQNGNIPSITWQHKTGPTLFHLVDRLNKLPAANIVVMAYRNAASGNDGTIFHSRTEVEYAQAKAPHVKVLIGQEVTYVEPVKQTFYDMSMTELSSEANLITEAFKDNPSYGGIALHDLEGLQELDQR